MLTAPADTRGAQQSRSACAHPQCGYCDWPGTAAPSEELCCALWCNKPLASEESSLQCLKGWAVIPGNVATTDVVAAIAQAHIPVSPPRTSSCSDHSWSSTGVPGTLLTFAKELGQGGGNTNKDIHQSLSSWICPGTAGSLPVDTLHPTDELRPPQAPSVVT